MSGDRIEKKCTSYPRTFISSEFNEMCVWRKRTSGCERNDSIHMPKGMHRLSLGRVSQVCS